MDTTMKHPGASSSLSSRRVGNSAPLPPGLCPRADIRPYPGVICLMIPHASLTVRTAGSVVWVSIHVAATQS